MKKAAKKVGQSILIAIITVIVWAVVVMNTGLYDALMFKRLILLAGIVLIVRLWFIGWNEANANQQLATPSNDDINNPDEESTGTSNHIQEKSVANVKVKTVAKAMLQSMVKDDYCAVTASELTEYCSNKYSLNITDEDCISAASFINSLHPNTSNIISTGVFEMPMMMIENVQQRQNMFRSDYSNSSLLKVLADINAKSD